jgi:DNA-binding transcriptional regulator YiaG
MTGTKFKPKKEFPFKIDNRLKHKLDILAKTLNKRDVWILVDGDEGTGKTNTAAYLLYYFHCVTGRDFSLDRFYFDSDEMFNWVKDHSHGLINWDEAALGGLSSEWYNKAQINLLKFAMTGRKKHHIFVLCIPRFNKLKEDLRKDRIHAMIHMDVGKKGNDYGHFVYLTRRGIKAINRIWEKNKIKPYARCAQKYGGFFCNTRIPFVFNKLVDEAKYEKKKDKAISEIGSKKGKDKNKQKLEDFQEKINQIIKENNLDREKIAETLGIHSRTIHKWSKRGAEKKKAPSPSQN